MAWILDSPESSGSTSSRPQLRMRSRIALIVSQFFNFSEKETLRDLKITCRRLSTALNGAPGCYPCTTTLYNQVLQDILSPCRMEHFSISKESRVEPFWSYINRRETHGDGTRKTFYSERVVQNLILDAYKRRLGTNDHGFPATPEFDPPFSSSPIVFSLIPRSLPQAVASWARFQKPPGRRPDCDHPRP